MMTSRHSDAPKRKLNEDVSRICKTPRLTVNCGPSSSSSFKHSSCCQTRSSLADNCHNFLNSGPPRRVMFYKQGQWLDFPEKVVLGLLEGFKNDKSTTIVMMDHQQFLVDFLSMFALNLKTRKQCSVAWIDESNKCFFPAYFFDEEAERSVQLDVDFEGISHAHEIAVVASPAGEVEKHVVAKSEVSGPKHSSNPISMPSLPKKCLAAEIVRSRVVSLDRKSENFLLAQNLFLSGMETFAKPDNICSIYRYIANDKNAQQRDAAFKSLVWSLIEKNGSANICRGWLGCNKADMVSTLIHGCCKVRRPNDTSLGNGVYLTPENRAFASVSFCDVDEKGFQYMVLCRMVLGNMEEVHRGQQEYLPSSKKYDSCVDNSSSPNFYVVPSSRCSYVLPEFVICFVLPPVVREYLRGLKGLWCNLSPTKNVLDPSHNAELHESVGKPPTSPWISFKDLFAEFEDSMSPVARELLFYHYEELKCGKINRENLVKKLRVIFGDKILMSALAKLQRGPSQWHSKPGERVEQLDPATTANKHFVSAPSGEKTSVIDAPGVQSEEPSTLPVTKAAI